MALASASTSPRASAQILPVAVTDGLDIRIWRDHMVQYRGFAAVLVAEGLVPADLTWPRGEAALNWLAKPFDYTLFRCAPKGHRGPKASWLALDYWALNVQVIGCDPARGIMCELNRRLDALLTEYRRHTTADGVSQWCTDQARARAIRRDRDYQAFKARVPGLAPVPRRQPKASVQAGASHD